jgi:hypothetical protein
MLALLLATTLSVGSLPCDVYSRISNKQVTTKTEIVASRKNVRKLVSYFSYRKNVRFYSPLRITLRLRAYAVNLGIKFRENAEQELLIKHRIRNSHFVARYQNNPELPFVILG